jgi:bile acid-coenzyme A ligase
MLAADHPEKTAVVIVARNGTQRSVPWYELDRFSNQVARFLAERLVGQGSMVVVGLPNCLEHFLVTIAVWKLGGCVLPLRASLPMKERDQILKVAQPGLVVADWNELPEIVLSSMVLGLAGDFSDSALPDRISHPGKAIASGGSTGLPKIIVDPRPWAMLQGEIVDSLGQWAGMRPDQIQLVAGPLYHNAPFCWSHFGLFEDHTLIVMEHFDAAHAVDLIEHHRVRFTFLVPTMMARIIRLPNVQRRDLSSVEAIYHTAAPCPIWLKQAWIDLIGAEKLYEIFGATEGVGFTSIRGDEWLRHRGSVGTPRGAELRIIGDDGGELSVNQIGEIFMRPKKRELATYEYVGSAPARTTTDGFVGLGDLGWVDEDGYLFIADRRVDLIISGGANIYPAEVETALTEHPAVVDAAVIGVSDEDWGKRVHAIIRPLDLTAPPLIGELDAHCRERLAAYKVPKSYEFVQALPREESGKIRRAGLVSEREQGWTPAMRRVVSNENKTV